jgi:hypothetical protein
MEKSLLGIAALLLSCSLGIAASAEPTQQETQRPALTFADSSTREDTATPLGEGISEEERERRVQECETLYEHCYDWCSRSKGGPACYNDCSKKNTECMGKIPYAR